MKNTFFKKKHKQKPNYRKRFIIFAFDKDNIINFKTLTT